jgi:hypothetical protein
VCRHICCVVLQTRSENQRHLHHAWFRSKFEVLTVQCVRLLLKAIEDSFKYQVSLCELYYREQWLEKKFVFNLVSLTFDVIDFLVNLQLFYVIIKRGALPIYILSEVLDNLTRIGKSVMSLYKWRQFIHKLKSLKDVQSSEQQQL